MKKRFPVRAVIVIGLISLPLFAFAQAGVVTTGINDFAGLITTVTNTIVKALATLLMALAVLAFFYGVLLYIWGLREGAGDKINKSKTIMTWGLVALFVMFSVYGIIRFAQGFLFSTTDTSTITIPKVNFAP